MKKIVMTLVAVVTLFATVSAQKQKEFKKGKRGHHHGMMMKNLNLSETQKKQLKEDNEAFKKQMKELNSNEKITVKEQRDRKQALLKERKAKFEGMLTPEQKTKMAEQKKLGEEKQRERAAKRMDKMKTNLGLSDEQVQRLKANRENIHSKMKAIKENDNLGREEKKAQLMALKEEHKASFEKVLTQEQLNKLGEMKKSKSYKRPAK
ncbi:MAG: hypothetical protein QM791_08235 [Ferruginibacter sp.]